VFSATSRGVAHPVANPRRDQVGDALCELLVDRPAEDIERQLDVEVGTQVTALDAPPEHLAQRRPPSREEPFPDRVRQLRVLGYGADQVINETPGVSSGLQLQPAEIATTVRVQDGKTLTTDGPCVAVKEALGGYLFFETDDLDAAIDIASRIPAARMGGAVEVRPLVEY
jgi:hypothetical protein